MLGERLGLTVQQRGDRSVRADGTIGGRRVEVEIGGDAARSEFRRFLFGLNTLSSRNRREKWHSTLTVSVVNPERLIGTIESSVDVNDPNWNPREYDPRNGRSVAVDSSGLQRVLTPSIHERLMSVMDDIRIDVTATDVRLDDDNTAIPGSGTSYVAGSVLHHYQGTPQPWPERALVGPPWWIDLLCDIADEVDR